MTKNIIGCKHSKRTQADEMASQKKEKQKCTREQVGREVAPLAPPLTDSRKLKLESWPVLMANAGEGVCASSGPLRTRTPPQGLPLLANPKPANPSPLSCLRLCYIRVGDQGRADCCPGKSPGPPPGPVFADQREHSDRGGALQRQKSSTSEQRRRTLTGAAVNHVCSTRGGGDVLAPLCFANFRVNTSGAASTKPFSRRIRLLMRYCL